MTGTMLQLIWQETFTANLKKDGSQLIISSDLLIQILNIGATWWVEGWDIFLPRGDKLCFFPTHSFNLI